MFKNDFLPSGEPAGMAASRQPDPRQRILVVEDDESIRRLNAEVLIYSGYHVDAAEDGAVAWEALQLNSYDLMVTDNNMPRMTGVDLLKQLHAARMALPIIMATGTLPQEELDWHPRLQIHAMLLKPYTIDALLASVKEVLRTTADVCGETAPPPNGTAARPHTQRSCKS
jgi:DNA-binding response OmpR family regulator